MKVSLPAAAVNYHERDGIIPNIQYKGSKLTTASPNNICMLQNRRILKISKIFFREGKVHIRGNEMEKIDYAYHYPINSDVTNIWEIKNNVSQREITVPIDSRYYV